MAKENISVSKFGNYLELRIHAAGKTGDRFELLSPKKARQLAIKLLTESEKLLEPQSVK